MTPAEAETKVRELQERLAAKRAEQDQRSAAREAAEQREPEIERLAVLVELGDLDPAEADPQKAAIAAEMDDAREAEKVGAAAIEELELRVETAGDEWAKAFADEAFGPFRAAERELRKAQQWLDEKTRERDALIPAAAAAREDHDEILAMTRESSAGRKAVLKKQGERTRRVLKAERLARHGQLDAAKAEIEHSPPRAKAEAEAKISEAYREHLAHERAKLGDPSASYTTPS
jgi:hypothetical protein